MLSPWCWFISDRCPIKPTCWSGWAKFAPQKTQKLVINFLEHFKIYYVGDYAEREFNLLYLLQNS